MGGVFRCFLQSRDNHFFYLLVSDHGYTPGTRLIDQSVQALTDYERTSCAAWGYRQPSEADIDRAYAGLVPGYFVGYWNETPVGGGGCTLAGEVARLWGTAVVPAFRGRGVYRALVRARLAQATAQGAALALVHAEPASSPVLQRLGFRVYGQRQVLALGRALAGLTGSPGC